jgi:hypothetical protein
MRLSMASEGCAWSDADRQEPHLRFTSPEITLRRKPNVIQLFKFNYHFVSACRIDALFLRVMTPLFDDLANNRADR